MKIEMQKYKKIEEIRDYDFTELPEYLVKEKSLERVRIRAR